MGPGCLEEQDALLVGYHQDGWDYGIARVLWGLVAYTLVNNIVRNNPAGNISSTIAELKGDTLVKSIVVND